MKKVLLKRFIAFAIDWNCIFILGMFLFFSGPDFDVKYLARPSMQMFSAWGVILSVICFLVLPLFRDCLFKNASLGKKLLKLEVVDKHSHKPIDFSRLVLRNIVFYLPVINMIFILFNKGESLADMIAKTAVITKRI